MAERVTINREARLRAANAGDPATNSAPRSDLWEIARNLFWAALAVFLLVLALNWNALTEFGRFLFAVAFLLAESSLGLLLVETRKPARASAERRAPDGEAA
ncbi:hypothetical protein K8I61_00810 [bacterium]|nr:hypothetical protein [bacterium]